MLNINPTIAPITPFINKLLKTEFDSLPVSELSSEFDSLPVSELSSVFDSPSVFKLLGIIIFHMGENSTPTTKPATMFKLRLYRNIEKLVLRNSLIVLFKP